MKTFLTLMALVMGMQTALGAPLAISKANNDFGASLLKINKPTAGKNVLLSPVSAFTALSMVNAGAFGTTSSEIQKVLQAASLTQGALNSANSELLRALNNADTVQVEIANSLWVRSGLKLDQDYESKISLNYRGVVRSEKFDDPKTVTMINEWAENKTHGKITKILDQIPVDTRAMLINATYFQGNWLNEFVPVTGTGDFTTAEGSVVKANFMQDVGTYQHMRRDGMEVIKLPYRQVKTVGKYDQVSVSPYHMMIVLPDTDSTLGKVVTDLSDDKLTEIHGQLTAEYGSVTLPKFSFNADLALKEMLINLGMRVAFTDASDLSGIVANERLKIGDAKQSAFIKVDEKGTEAAAVTVISAVPAGIAPKIQFEMKVDRPFLFVIQDDATGAVLFFGEVNNPLAK